MPDTFSPSQNPSGIIIIRKRKVETWVEITEKSLVKKMRSVNGKPEDGFETDGAANKELDRRFYHNKVAEQLDKYEDELESLRTEKETLQGEIRDLHNNYSKLQVRLDTFETFMMTKRGRE
ncbi:hypothetical protein I302_106932 [Kwoniella bestiolae CBS 10118]|uniref:Uncharacterized protein n=1 Tax=Kwoniella bestiolae CBS 10118 TaxID=1296100 RepID=A0A1B9G003_9TREE|nr:hypothetical protein I302_05802 [Kwoniella bestiolae CBS 10118]OCF24343.1 hypothetical protein I302_05802 [Kwoniella bestiolae CBS 10118]